MSADSSSSSSDNPLLPPFPPAIDALRASQKSSFAYPTVKDRLPIILTKCVDAVSKQLHSESSSSSPTSSSSLKHTQGKAVISDISKLIYELQRDRPLTPFTDSEPDVDLWNACLTELTQQEGRQPTWFTSPWLFVECAMYRKLREIFGTRSEWKEFDVFMAGQKEPVFWASVKGMTELAGYLEEVRERLGKGKGNGIGDGDVRAVLEEFIQFSLWGNQTDLSLLQNVAHSSMHTLQTSSATGLDAMRAHIIVDHTSAVIDHLLTPPSSPSHRRVDIVLDNAGFELFADLCLADLLLSTSLAHQITFHSKHIPWFVSDTTPADLTYLLHHLSPGSSPSGSYTPTREMETTVERWRGYIRDGRWVVRDDGFWTTPLPIWALPTTPSATEMYTDMCTSHLWILKGDLNYRKAVYDLTWPTTTALGVALGGLVEGMGKQTPPVVLLRTCKSDPAVGLAEGQEGQLDNKDGEWRVNGKWGMIQFHR
ncbi:uncharacterized protein EV422DRAFT_565308 [Fimicolochytrium jonesii]|uniref:uncharacterized protein n=1 Tax=Fimicolochytrium jonesii TaxID=1396493 RepID=UPI0022FF3AEC|nr:uncharacterized protein EV422DRAFT_565308 [Fimicolochytrium jonesii]KAI8823359.1 hypothetical protein EV422DRAFT_565308 [Fimicolochytrium jonesii]